jgi:hypothetical protein
MSDLGNLGLAISLGALIIALMALAINVAYYTGWACIKDGHFDAWATLRRICGKEPWPS